jgi:hypothetical protein
MCPRSLAKRTSREALRQSADPIAAMSASIAAISAIADQTDAQTPAPTAQRMASA